MPSTALAQGLSEAPPDPSAELVAKLRNLADSLEGAAPDEKITIKSVVMVMECESGELVPVALGHNDWARTTGLIFAAAQQVSRGDGDEL